MLEIRLVKHIGSTVGLDRLGGCAILYLLPIELFHWASDLKLGSFEDSGLTSYFQSHCVLLHIGLFINLVGIGFDNGLGHVCKINNKNPNNLVL